MSDSNFPTMTDGRRGPRQPIVKCWNILESSLPKRYHWLKDSIKASGMSLDHLVEDTGEHVGGFSGASARKGSLTILLDDAADKIPLPGMVIELVKAGAAAPVSSYYRVDEADEPMEGKQQVTVTLTVTRLVHPFFTGILSEDEGDTKRVTYSIATMGTTETITAAPVNHRTGSTKAYSLLALNDTTTFPGIEINASTGVITITKASVAAGVYEVDVLATDTLANKRTLKGGCKLVVTITA